MTEQERYIERVRNAFENFLVSKFIEYKPYSISDDRIISDARERSAIKYDGGSQDQVVPPQDGAREE